MFVDNYGTAKRPRWRIRDRVGGRALTIESGFPNKTIALKKLHAMEVDKAQGTQLDRRAGKITLREWVAEWEPGYMAALKPSSQRSEGSRLRSLIVGMLGDIRLADLSPIVIGQWIAEMQAEDLSSKSIRNAHALLSQVVAATIPQRLRRDNPCTETRLPKREHHEMRFLTEPEAARLLAAVPEYYRGLVALILGTGMRWGEAAAMTVKCVDLLAGTARVEKTLHELDHIGLVLTEPKTRSSRRTVSLPRWVVELLIPLVAAAERDEFVFLSGGGKGPIRTRNFRNRVWIPAIQAAGLGYEKLPGGKLGPGVRIHDLRHTHAAWLISARHPLTAIQRRLGHTSITITSDLYGHLLPEVDTGMIATLDAAIGSVGDSETVGTSLELSMARNGAEPH